MGKNKGGQKSYKNVRNKNRDLKDNFCSVSNPQEMEIEEESTFNVVKLSMWDLEHCNPKICSGRKLFRLKRLRILKMNEKFNGIVLAPDATEPLDFENDIDIMKQNGLAVVDCSWAQVGKCSNLGKLKFKHGRTLPYFVAANPVNYGKPYKLNCAEALAGMLAMAGFREQAEDLMNCFGWGHSFISLNSELFDQYMECKNRSELLDCQKKILDDLENEDEVRQSQKAANYNDIYAGLDEEFGSGSEESDHELAQSSSNSFENVEDNEFKDLDKPESILYIESQDEYNSGCEEVEDTLLKSVKKIEIESSEIKCSSFENEESVENSTYLREMNIKTDEKRVLNEEQLKLIEKQNSTVLNDFQTTKFEKDAKKHWDLFYKRNKTNFFKDRHWLAREFKDLETLFSIKQEENSPKSTLLEVGCGVGNFFLPLIEDIKDFDTNECQLYCCDFSPIAIDLLKQDERYIKANDGDVARAFVADITQHDLLSEVGEMGLITCIFVLSAIHPDKHGKALSNVLRCLRVGGKLLFRDYGLYDHAQIRFGRKTKMAENWYVRQDGTRSFFFTLEYLGELVAAVTNSDDFRFSQHTYVVTKTENKAEQLSVERIFVQSVVERIR